MTREKIKKDEVKHIEIILTVKVNGKEVALNDDELSSILTQILQPTVTYSRPIFIQAYDA